MHFRSAPRILCFGVGFALALMTGCGEADSGSEFDSAEPIAGSAPQGKGDIFGEDSREEFFDVQEGTLLQAADKVAVLALSKTIQPTSEPEQFKFESDTLSENFKGGLCEDVPFRDQVNGGFCTGFLVGPQLLATAGHCTHAIPCSETSVVFDYRYDGDGQDPNVFSKAQLYHCTHVLVESNPGSLSREAPDYALIQLDRPVTRRDTKLEPDNPQAWREPFVPATSDPEDEAAVALLGHPSGLPLKVVADGTVLPWSVSLERLINIVPEYEEYFGSEAFATFMNSYFPSELDVFGGNSGGPIVDPLSGKLFGIVANSFAKARDNVEVGRSPEWYFSSPEGCYRPSVCDRDISCGGLNSTRLSTFKHLIPPALDDPGWNVFESYDGSPSLNSDPAIAFSSLAVSGVEGRVAHAVVDVEFTSSHPSLPLTLTLVHKETKTKAFLRVVNDHDNEDLAQGRQILYAPQLQGQSAQGEWMLFAGTTDAETFPDDYTLTMDWKLHLKIDGE